MKKIITFSTVCIVISLLFSSCGSNTSITKRHYNKGYHIAHTKGKHKVVAENKDEKVVQLKNKNVSLTDPSKGKIIQNPLVEYKASSTVTDNAPLIASTNKTPIVAKNPVKHVTTFNLFPIKEVKHSIFSKKRVSPPTEEHDHLSLLWIVILVLLILWVLGLIGGGWGLGVFINLLLIIALVLLILWLLRII